MIWRIFRHVSIAAFILPAAILGATIFPAVSAGFNGDERRSIPDPDFFDDGRTVVEDLIDISIVDRKILGIINGETVIAEELKINEKVFFRETKGLMGLVMTDRRLLAVSTFTSSWIEQPLDLMEVRDDTQPDVLISDFLILVVTRGRLLGFDSRGSHWIKEDIVIHDDVMTAKIGKRVAVVVTSERAVGLAVGSTFFDDIRFKKGEKVISVETRPLNANVLTNKRLLIFQATTALWKEFDKDFY